MSGTKKQIFSGTLDITCMYSKYWCFKEHRRNILVTTFLKIMKENDLKRIEILMNNVWYKECPFMMQKKVWYYLPADVWEILLKN